MHKELNSGFFRLFVVLRSIRQCVFSDVCNFEPRCKRITIQLCSVILRTVHFQHLSAMHLTVCPMSPSKLLWNGSYGWKTYLVALIRYLVYKFLRPAATFNLTPYSMLCNLNFLSGVIYTSLPIFTSLRIARVNTALLAHNLRDGTWQTLSFSITLWMCRERTISWVGILLNEGGAEAVHMSQIWRRRPTGF